MTTLSHKISTLRTEGTKALRLADYLESLKSEHGEPEATRLYLAACSRKAGHRANMRHPEPNRKSVEWEGLTLSRQPTAVEQIAVKSVADAQESGKEKITKILLSIRQELITEAIGLIKESSAADYHTIVLTPSKSERKKLRGVITEVYERGRGLVSEELSKQGAGKSIAGMTPDPLFPRVSAKVQGYPLPEGMAGGAVYIDNKWVGNVYAKSNGGGEDEEIDDLDTLTDATLSKLTNSIQSRVVDIASGLAIAGVVGNTLISRLREQADGLSTRPEELTATAVSNQALGMGRNDEAQERSDEWDRIEYSALLDKNVCEVCETEDGKTATDEADLAPAPNPDCEGGALCRCFHVFIVAGG